MSTVLPKNTTVSSKSAKNFEKNRWITTIIRQYRLSLRAVDGETGNNVLKAGVTRTILTLNGGPLP
jgi:hypothetical protein